MMTQDHSKPRDLLLWTAFLAPAFAWFIQLTASYTIAAYACATGRIWILHGTGLVALVIAGAGIWCGRKHWRDQRSHKGQDETETEFLTGGTLLLALLFFLTILAGELSNWLLEPCK